MMKKSSVLKPDGTPKRLKRAKAGKVNPMVIAKLAQAGMSRNQIARTIGCDPSTVTYHQQRLAALAQSPALAAYRESKGHILDAVESRLVGALMDESKLEGASLNNIAYAFRQVADIGRLERGQSTANVGVVMGILEAVHKNPMGSPAHTTVKVLEPETGDTVDTPETSGTETTESPLTDDPGKRASESEVLG